MIAYRGLLNGHISASSQYSKTIRSAVSSQYRFKEEFPCLF